MLSLVNAKPLQAQLELETHRAAPPRPLCRGRSRARRGSRHKWEHGHVLLVPSINHRRFIGYLSGCPNPQQLTNASLLQTEQRDATAPPGARLGSSTGPRQLGKHTPGGHNASCGLGCGASPAPGDPTLPPQTGCFHDPSETRSSANINLHCLLSRALSVVLRATIHQLSPTAQQ